MQAPTTNTSTLRTVPHRAHAVDAVVPASITALPTDPSRRLDRTVDALLRDLWAISTCATSTDAAARFDALLGRLGRALCRVLGLTRCSIYLTTDALTFRGAIFFDASSTRDAEVRARAVDAATDQVTAELVRTRAPVVVADARTDARPHASVVHRLRICDLVAVPLVVDEDVIGAAYLDDAGRAHHYAPDAVASAAFLAQRVSSIVRQGQALLAMRRHLDRARAERELLERTTRGQLSVDAVAIEGGRPHQLLAQLGNALGRPVLLLGAARELLQVASADGGYAAALRASWRAAPFDRHASEGREPSPRVLPPLPVIGLTTRQLLVPIALPCGSSGALVALEVGRRFDAADGRVLDRAAAVARLAWGRSERAEPSGRSGTALRQPSTSFGELSAASVHERVGFPAVVVWLADADGSAGRRLAVRLGVPERCHLLPHSAGTAVVVPGGDAAAIAATIEQGDSDGRPPLAVVSRPATSPEAVVAACAEVDAIATMLVRNRVARGVVSIDDLGGGRLVLATCTVESAARIVDETLQPLAASAIGDALSVVLLETVRTSIATGGSIREAARRLGVHENTVRYRLRRIRDLTGLDPSVAGELFQFQVAMSAWEQLGFPLDAAG